MFRKAKPVWIRDKEKEMNVYAVFKTEAESRENMELHIAGTANYRVSVNGRFLASGPARTARGYVREDILPIGKGSCVIVVEAAGYYCCSLNTVKQPSFILAEVQQNGNVLACTGKDFAGYMPGFKLQKVERYSIQRHFTEVWDYRACHLLFDEKYRKELAVCREMPMVLDRRAPYPLYEDIDLYKEHHHGTFVFDETKAYRENHYTWKEIPECWGRFEQKEIQYRPYKWIQRQKQTVTGRDQKLPILLKKGEYVSFDFGRIEAGFLKTCVTALQESDIVIGYSEYCAGDEFQYTRMSGQPVLEYLIAGGDSRQLQSFEPYSFRRVIVLVKEGSVRIESFGVKTYMYDTSNLSVAECENKIQRAILQAAVRTFAHNAVDLYTDCPSRERGGWLCDSYFTAKAEYAITGKTLVEDAFLENYRLFKNQGEYPKGVLPDCYPSDVRPVEDYFIPQWTMWYILQAEEYILIRGHAEKAEAFRESIYELLEFYRRYENEDGLLEDLPSWNFVEWSKANEWTRNVNYPTNFLYARVLEAVYNLYKDEACRRRCQSVRRAAVEQSFNGKYFLDHAVRDEKKKLQTLPDSSEACQYYAILFAGIDINEDKYACLKHLILHVFSPDRHGVMPEIFEVNAFIGAYLRMDALLKMQEYRMVLRDAEQFFGKMSVCTQTLWEYREERGSRDHGFASYAYAVICEALNGIKKDIDKK